jgi:hypothetical protein
MNECIICLDNVPSNEQSTIECGCNYIVHIQCIEKWNGKCVICNEPIHMIDINKYRQLYVQCLVTSLTLFVLIIIWDHFH